MDRRKYDGGEGATPNDEMPANPIQNPPKTLNHPPNFTNPNRRQMGNWQKNWVPAPLGDIYIGHNVLTEGKVAIKVENKRNPHPQLEYEARVYKKYLTGTRKKIE